VYYFNGINFISQELFEVAGTDFTTGIAATNHGSGEPSQRPLTSTE
jgi:hypothetical protein